MIFRARMIIYMICTLSILAPIYAQKNYDKQISSNQTRLKSIRNEIKQLKENIRKSGQQASSINQQIALIDKEMALISQAKGLLQKEQRLLAQRAENNQMQLNATRKRLEQLRSVFKARLIYMYKYGRSKTLALLVASKSINQALIRFRYLKQISDYDSEIIHEIEQRKEGIREIQSQLKQDMAYKSRSIRSKKTAEKSYKQKKKEKNHLLARVRKNQNYFKNQLAVKQGQQKQIRSMIVTLENMRSKSDETTPEKYVKINFDNFKKGKRKLPWPVRGKVISNFGKQYDPGTKTYTTNSGIEINSKLGTPVKCVFRGVVRLITYMSGYGNTIIIDHGKGYYSVYSYLGEIYVHKNDVVDTNQIIAQVGESGSLSGSKLHFEIYAKNLPNNPLSWLR